MSKSETTDPATPQNDREFQVWEHGRRQGHAEAQSAVKLGLAQPVPATQHRVAGGNARKSATSLP